MEILLEKEKTSALISVWLKENPTTIHPLSNFLDSIGLQFKKTYRAHSLSCEVIDQKKYMLAKIKYGI
jgi:hypothetical protein